MQVPNIRSKQPRLIWCGVFAKGVDHILVSTCWRFSQSYIVYLYVKFFATNHRLFIVTLRIHVKSQMLTICHVRDTPLQGVENL